MAKRPLNERGKPEAEVLQIRITGGQSTTAAKKRHPRPPRPTLLVAIVVVAVLAAGLAILARSRQHSRPQTPAAARALGAAGVAGAYGYPRRCLSITIPADAPAYARADFDRGQSCGRYDGSTTAIFHRGDGAWRVVLDAATYTCPVPAIPLPVQDELGVCDAYGR